MINVKNIPHHFCDDPYGTSLNIIITKYIKKISEIHNELTDEITGYLYIRDTINLEIVNCFYNLTKISGQILIHNNKKLTQIQFKIV